MTIFDLAMKSRIHLAIEYSPPELQMRRTIWTLYLKAIPSSDIAIDFDSAIDRVIRDEVNGREIANAVSTSRTLARSEKQPLQLRHIQTVLQVRRDFDVSLAKKAREIDATESRQNSMVASNRKNSILVSSDQPSAWVP